MNRNVRRVLVPTGAAAVVGVIVATLVVGNGSGPVRAAEGDATAQNTVSVSGLGRVQLWGEPIREIRPGDTVWIPPGEKHWHGAAAATGMVHIAMQESLDGTHVTWLEHVTDEQYGADLKA